MRTKAQLKEAEKLLKKAKGELIEIINFDYRPPWLTRAFKNNRYCVMLDDNATLSGGVPAIRVMIQRHDDQPIFNHWRELQAIKKELFGAESWAVEFYPSDSELVDDANIYWLWVFSFGSIPTYQKSPLIITK